MTKKKAAPRSRLLETASRLFLERGYSEVGVDEIIEGSQTAKATFYRHFPSKENLVEAWLEAMHESAEERQNMILRAEGSPVQKIAESFDALVEFMTKHDFRGCPYSNSCAVTEPGNQAIRKQIELHKQSSRSFYQKLCSSITEDREAAAGLGDRIFILYSGATTEAQNLRALWPIETARDAAVEICRNRSR